MRADGGFHGFRPVPVVSPPVRWTASRHTISGLFAFDMSNLSLMRTILLALSFSLLALRLPAQARGLKEQALESFRQERYDEAVALMERAAEADPTDAESWYYLGFFSHYRAYDSRPLKGYDLSYSERVFSYLDRALELDPSLGDARYF